VQAALLELPERSPLRVRQCKQPDRQAVALRFFVENLFDNDYWASGFAAITLSLGTPRTFRLALTTDFQGF
jgi:iron complex outermembrane recepter protein